MCFIASDWRFVIAVFRVLGSYEVQLAIRLVGLRVITAGSWLGLLRALGLSRRFPIADVDSI